MSDENEKAELERQAWLNELVVEIKEDFSSYQQTLKGFEDIQRFYTTEKDFWTSVAAEVQSKNISNDNRIINISAYFDQCVKRLSNFRNDVNNFTNKTQFEQQWSHVDTLLKNPRSYSGAAERIYSKSAVGILIANLYREHPNRGDGGLKYFLRLGINIGRSEETVGFITAYMFDHPDEEARKREIESLEGIRNEWEQKTHNLRSEFENQKTDLGEWKRGFIEEHNQWKSDTKGNLAEYLVAKQIEFQSLRESYESLLKLQAPVKYWKARAKSYHRRGQAWVIGLAGVVLITVELLTMVLYDLPQAFHRKLFAGEPEAIKGLIIFVTMISFLVYLARVFSRMTFSSFHIETDAEEREQLTYVYLALINSGGIKDQEREIVLQSLFSRVETGLLGDDSSPTMPVIGELLDQLLRKK